MGTHRVAAGKGHVGALELRVGCQASRAHLICCVAPVNGSLQVFPPVPRLSPDRVGSPLISDLCRGECLSSKQVAGCRSFA